MVRWNIAKLRCELSVFQIANMEHASCGVLVEAHLHQALKGILVNRAKAAILQKH